MQVGVSFAFWLARPSANRKLAQVASMNAILIRLGHESLDVTLAYLKGKDADPNKRRNMRTAAARTGDEVQVARIR